MKDDSKRVSNQIEMGHRRLFSVSRLSWSAMIVWRYNMLRFGEPHCTFAWRKLVVVCQRQPMRWLALMRTLPLLSSGRLRKQSRARRSKVAMRLIVLRNSSKVILAFGFVAYKNVVKICFFCLHNCCQYLPIKRCEMQVAGANAHFVGPYRYHRTV